MHSTENKEHLIPCRWFDQKFPEVCKKHGLALNETTQQGIISVKGLNEDYLAETIGQLGNPDAPTVYVTAEGRFYTYEPPQGIYVVTSEECIITRLSTLLHECANACERR